MSNEEKLKQEIKYLKKINELIRTESFNNEACKGYIIKALENLEYSREDIKNILNELRFIFDEKTVKEAQEYYIEY